MSTTIDPAMDPTRTAPTDPDYGPAGTDEIDPSRWPDVAAVPRAPVRAALAGVLLRRVAKRMPLRIALPDGRTLGRAPDGAPTMRVHRPQALLRRLGAFGLIGFGESYQAGEWDAAGDLAGLLGVFAENVEAVVPKRLQWLRHLHGSRPPKAEMNTVDGARRNIERHYDLSNEMFAAFLDDTMTYSSALFDTDAGGHPLASSGALAEAQRRKIDRLLDQCQVGPGTRVLEIGTGWGELALRAARRGASVHTVTISAEQYALAARRFAHAGVTDRITLELRDYRDIPRSADGTFDAVVSVEMIEAVGEEFWPTYFQTIDRLLAPNGRVGIQAITMSHERMLVTRNTYTWIQKYIFPGGLIPSVRAIEEVCLRHTRLRVQDLLGFGQHYAQTLRLWRERFNASAGRVRELGFDRPFRRTWNFYLAYCEAGFAKEYLDVHQIVLGHATT